MQMIVGTTPVRVPVDMSVTPVLQNLGPGNVYWDGDPNVSATTGFKLTPNAAYEFARDLNQGAGSVYLVADAVNTDVRIVSVG